MKLTLKVLKGVIDVSKMLSEGNPNFYIRMQVFKLLQIEMTIECLNFSL